MPKYFTDEKTFPPPLIRLTLEDLEFPSFGAAFSDINVDQPFTIAVGMPGMAPSSLGYVFFATKKGPEQFELRDVKGALHFTAENLNDLLNILHHCSGLRFDADIQSRAYRARNEITS